MPPRWSEVRRATADWPRLLLIVAVGMLALALADVLLPLRTDWFGTSRVVAPYLALLFLPILGVGLAVRGRVGRGLCAVALVGLALGAARFLTGLPTGAVAAGPGTTPVHVATWNLYLGAVPPDRLADALVARAPAIIGLEELTPGAAAAIEADPAVVAAYPYRVLHPSDDWSGMGLLSAWPLVGTATTDDLPPLIDATVAVTGARRPLSVVVAHAPPPIWRPSLFGPAYDPGLRDAALDRLHARAERHAGAGDPVVVLGDLNLTDREPAYDDLARGLTDCYRAAGSGFGTTWRPPVGDGLPFGLLRIDMAFTGPGVSAVRSEPDCTPRRSDHCILDVTLAVPAAGS